jgi:hypothetical protein
MGTATDWISVAMWGLGWGGLMLFRGIRLKRKAQLTPVTSVVDIIGCASLGLWYGLLMTFHWKAFQWPLLLFNVATLAGGAFLLDKLSNKKVLSSD